MAKPDSPALLQPQQMTNIHAALCTKVPQLPTNTNKHKNLEDLRRSGINMVLFSCHTTELVLTSLQWCRNEHDGVSNHQPYDCLLNGLFRCSLKKTSKLRITGLCEGNSLVIGEFPAQRASNAENVSIWWRLHAWTPILARFWPTL